jgi:uncharacterized protein
MSRNFIKDPREVVKPGDIVKVKVLDVEVARKRISLTLRLDDEVASKNEGKNASRGASGTSAKSSPKVQEPANGGALAEALRRAAAKSGRQA